MTNVLKIKVTVVRETEKALLIEAEGRTGWVQRRWFKNGEVSKAVFEANTSTSQQIEAAKFITVKRIRETEKAVLVPTIWHRADGESEKQIDLWFPKSQLNESGQVPRWMFVQKIAEKKAEIGYGFSCGGAL